MTEQLLFAGQAFLNPDTERLSEMLAYLPDGERYRALMPAREELLREHTRLFFAPEGAPCAPWQSVHGEEPTIMGASHHSALAWYRSAGMEPAVENEPADHVGLLLSFYAKLVDEATDPATIALFREEHLAWVPQYCETLERQARLPLLQTLARDTREALTSN
jgi:TorA maturation chaperone TorD